MKMERIKTIEQLRLQKEILEVQRLIAELRIKKEFQELRGRFSITRNLLPSVGGLVKAGLTTAVGKQLFYSTATKLVKRIFRKKKRSMNHDDGY
jgi:hypothetical protein